MASGYFINGEEKRVLNNLLFFFTTYFLELEKSAFQQLSLFFGREGDVSEYTFHLLLVRKEIWS